MVYIFKFSFGSVNRIALFVHHQLTFRCITNFVNNGIKCESSILKMGIKYIVVTLLLH